MKRIYTDPTTGEFVSEFERPCLLTPGEVHRDTEWFSSQEAALQFAQTGAR
jgi:hypothetical protein